jgi:hypothetical protein
MAVYYSVNQFNIHKENGLFTSIEQEAAERLAHTFQCLTLQGRKYLYPKADQLLEEQKNLCRPNKLEL